MLQAGLRRAFAALAALYTKIRGAVEIGPPYPWEAAYPAGIDWHAEIETKPLFAILDEAVIRYPDKCCLEFYGKELSYGQVGELVAKAAKGFQELGVTKGVKVGLFLPNSPYFVICFYGVLKAGGTVVNYNPLYAGPEVARQIRDSETRIMVTMDLKPLYEKAAARLADTELETIVVCRMSSAFRFPARALFAIVKRKEIARMPADARHVKYEKLIANDGDPAPVDIDPDRDIAVLQYTGGIKGVPMGAMLTHGNLYANNDQMRMWANTTTPGAEKFLAVLPLSHVFGMTGVMNAGLRIGAELILLPRFKTDEVLKAIDRQRPTVLLAVPTIYAMFNNYKDIDKHDLSSLNLCISGGAPLPLEIKTAFERLTGQILVEGYGLTEAGPICTVGPFAGPDRPGSVGMPIPGTRVKLVSLRNPRRPVPLGKVGEVWVSGPQVMAGYWRRPEETAAVRRNGFLRTGDVGYMDKDGYLYLTDRVKDLVITGGFNVYPRMVEEAIALHPAVEAVKVSGVADAHRGEIVKAHVKLREGASLTGSELRGFLRDKLAPFEMPRKIEFGDALPAAVSKARPRKALAKDNPPRTRETPAPA